ncbi:MAG TPA: 8-oxoguanine deaminase [Burkholderiales bacterium]|nr:8-oxoguanine deaminase [Burkholderiales bacterium]
MLLLRNALVAATMDSARREIANASVLIDGRRIHSVGPAAEIDAWIAQDPAHRTPMRTLDLSGCVVLPGLVNGHHHLYQTLTRTIGTSAGLELFDWLKLLYPIWGRMNPEAVRVGTLIGLAELVLSGATTVADHLYLFPNGSRLDDEIDAARAIGVRFHPTRGSMSLGESKGGLPPDNLVEDERAILADCERVIATFHDPAPGSMLRIGLAPCSPFTVSRDLMRETATLAYAHDRVGLHTHLAEVADEERFCLAKFGQRPVDYAESLGWLNDRTWFAHVVCISAPEISRLARARTGVCHCPTSNMILGSGISPVRQMMDAGVKVALGVDGSASNDGNHMLGEARQAMLLQRVAKPAANVVSAREALELATLGGAAALGRDDIGSLEPGKCADLVAFRVDDLEHAGSLSDPIASLVTCAPGRAWLSVIDGRIVVESGELTDLEIGPIVETHNRISRRMLQEAGHA